MNATAIKSIRKTLNETQVEFARRFGVSSKTIQRWELGLTEPLPVFKKQLEQMKETKTI